MNLARRSLMLLAGGLAGCSVLPDRPYQETQRFALLPERPQRLPVNPRRPVLLLRTIRAAPGLELRGLRSVGADGRVENTYWAEWAGPPADLAEEALRRWLVASGRVSAVLASGSRLPAELVLEGELIRLEVAPAEGVARAGLSLLLLGQAGGEQPRILAPIIAEATAPLPSGRAATASENAAAMTAAFAEVLTMAERGIAGALGPRA